MTKPPKGDPQRPLYLAVRSTRALGILHLIIGALVTGGMAYSFSSLRGGFMAGMIWILVVYGVILLGPGVLYLLFSIFMQRRHFWAIVTTIVLASIQAMFLLLSVAGIVMQMVFGIGFEPAMLIPSGIVTLFLAALVVLIVQLAKSFSSLKTDRIDYDRGFVPIMGTPPADTETQGLYGDVAHRE